MFPRRISTLGLSAGLHVLAVIVTTSIAALPARATRRGTDAQPPSVVVVHLDALPARLVERASPKKTDGPPEDLGIVLPDGSTSLALPGFAFDFGKVVHSASSLFPFLTDGSWLEAIAGANGRNDTARLVNPLGRHGQAPERKPPLRLPATQLQSLLDRCWSRRDRWRAFEPIADLTAAYDPDRGNLPVVLSAYGTQNGLQPYVDTTIRDPRFWVQLGLAADHRDFIEFITGYVTEHGSTKASTELLFLLDKLVQASLDALTVLLDTDPKEELQWTEMTNRGAYAAAVAIRDYYRAHLESRTLASRELLIARYGDVRRRILEIILDTTPNGYRANDARFALGGIYWRGGRREAAAAAWRAITIDGRDNDAADYADLLTELERPDGSHLGIRRIDRILERSHSRWISLSYDRLKQFGYHFDTF